MLESCGWKCLINRLSRIFMRDANEEIPILFSDTRKGSYLLCPSYKET